MTWHEFPPLRTNVPVLALAAGDTCLWAGGLGGAARFRDSAWRQQASGLRISAVAALAYAGGWLLAGGPEGIACSRDGGLSWSMAVLSGTLHPANVILPSPNFGQDKTFLAATLGGGLLRSDSAGQVWKPSNFGLQSYEINALAWRADDLVLAATADGLYRSPNGGRAWRSAGGSEGMAYMAVAFLEDGSALAALEHGGLVRSDDQGATWTPCEIPGLPARARLAALHAGRRGLYLSCESGTYCLAAGELRRLDAGTAQVFAGTEESTYLGMEDGILVDSAAGVERLPAAPLHDLRSLFVNRHTLHVYGLHSGLIALSGNEWKEFDQLPAPLILACSVPDGSLLASGPGGLLHSRDNGQTWETQVPGEEGMVSYITFRRDGHGWAASADGARLLYSPNYGRVWKPIPAPFGVLPVAALQASEEALIAATFDPRRKMVQFLASHDDGKTWRRGAESRSEWPLVSSCREPTVLTTGQRLFVYQKDRTWNQIRLTDEKGEILRVASDGGTLLALTTTRLLQSTDLGQSWRQIVDLPCDRTLLDAEIAHGELYLLFGEGRLWSRPLP